MTIIKNRMYELGFRIYEFVHYVEIVDTLLDDTIVHHENWCYFFSLYFLSLYYGGHVGGLGWSWLVGELEEILHCVKSDENVFEDLGS